MRFPRNATNTEHPTRGDSPGRCASGHGESPRTGGGGGEDAITEELPPCNEDNNVVALTSLPSPSPPPPPPQPAAATSAASHDIPKFVLKLALGDGNCLFRSVSLQVFGDAEWHDRVREQAMDWIAKNKDHFEDFVSGDFTTYVERKRRLGCYADNPEIQAIAELYNRPVVVLDGDRDAAAPAPPPLPSAAASATPTSSNNTGAPPLPVEFPNGEKRYLLPLNIFHGRYEDAVPIRVCYRGRGHYDAVVDEHNATVGVGLGLPAYDPGAADRKLVVEATKESEATARHQEEKLALEVRIATDVEATEREWEKAAIAASLEDMWALSNNGTSLRKRTSGSGGGGGASSGGGGGGGGYHHYHQGASLYAKRRRVVTSPGSSCAAGGGYGGSGSSSSAATPMTTPLESLIPSVRELVMNGFPLQSVLLANQAVGDNFDDMLAVLLAEDVLRYA